MNKKEPNLDYPYLSLPDIEDTKEDKEHTKSKGL
jgi:hypothetical protein